MINQPRFPPTFSIYAICDVGLSYNLVEFKLSHPIHDEFEDRSCAQIRVTKFTVVLSSSGKSQNDLEEVTQRNIWPNRKNFL